MLPDPIRFGGPGARPRALAPGPRPQPAFLAKAVLTAAALGAGALGPAHAQDVIVKNDQSRISSKVVEITDEHIKYRLFDFLDGPLYNIRKTEVALIVYEQGRREQFNAPAPAIAAAPAPAEMPAATPAPPPAAEPAATAAVAAADEAPAPAEPATPAVAAEPAAPTPAVAAEPAALTPAEPAAPAPAAAATMAAAPASADEASTPAEAPAAPLPNAVPRPAPAPAVAAAPYVPTRAALPASTAGQLLWTKAFGGFAAQKYVNADGNLLVLTPTAVVCLVRGTGQELWQTPLAEPVGANLLAGTPFVEVQSRRPNTTYHPSSIIDTRTGKVVYSPANVAQMGNRVVAADNLVVWEATDTSTKVLILDQKTGAQLADFPIASARSRSGTVVGRPDGQLLFYSADYLVALNPKAGKLLYSTPLKKSGVPLPAYYQPMFELIETDRPDRVCLLKDGYLTSLNLQTGQVLGEKDLLTHAVVTHRLDQNQLIMARGAVKKGIILDVYDLATGQLLRSAEPGIANAVSMAHQGNDLFLISNSTMGGSSVKLLDLSALALKADKTFRTGGGFYGRIFKTSTGMGLQGQYSVDFYNAQTYAGTHGTKYYDPKGKAVQAVDDDTYFFANGYLGRVNLAKAEEALLLPGKLPVRLLEGEVPELEVTPDGVLVVCAQSLAKVGFDGRLVYNQYFAPPGPSAGSVIGNGLLLAASAALSTNAASQSQAARTSTVKQDWASKQKDFEKAGSYAGKNLRAKYAKSENALNYTVMLAKADRDAAGRFKLVKVNKATGQAEGQVELESRTPDYIFDPIDGLVYLFEGTTVKAYKI